MVSTQGIQGGIKSIKRKYTLSVYILYLFKAIKYFQLFLKFIFLKFIIYPPLSNSRCVIEMKELTNYVLLAVGGL